MTDNERELLDACCDQFDFERVHKTMEFLNWTWAATEGVPNLFDIKQHVRKAFKNAIERAPYEEKSVEGSGGFMYEVFRESGKVIFVRMRFELCSSEYDVDYLGE